MARVQLFIDGFNLYHSIMRDPKLRGYRWLNFRALGESVITRNEVLTDIYYFTAFYPGDAAKTQRHNLFINSQTLHGVTTVLGAFRAKAKYCPLCGKTSRGYEEKETDVNMAVYLLKNAVLNEYDKA
ncbi:MAG: NYN domain-containing protein, partial [Candidatus Hydrogenedentales bacterium]